MIPTVNKVRELDWMLGDSLPVTSIDVPMTDPLGECTGLFSCNLFEPLMVKSHDDWVSWESSTLCKVTQELEGELDGKVVANKFDPLSGSVSMPSQSLSLVCEPLISDISQSRTSLLPLDKSKECLTRKPMSVSVDFDHLSCPLCYMTGICLYLSFGRC